jgi:predicted ATP-dependent protease
MDDDERAEIYDAFREAVNMTPSELDEWLASDESAAVGRTREREDEAIGHKSGRRIVEIKRTRRADLTDDDYAHMRKVVGYVHRHVAQGGPSDDKAHSRWRYSLMNWGHDPLK